MAFNPQIVVAAWVAGAEATATNLATTTIQELYDGLRSLMRQRVAHLPLVLEQLDALSSTPEGAEVGIPLAEILAASIAPDTNTPTDDALQRISEMLLQQTAAAAQTANLQAVQAENGIVAKSVELLSTDEGADSSSLIPSSLIPPLLVQGPLRQQLPAVEPNLQRTAAKAVIAKDLSFTPTSEATETEDETPQVDLIGQLKDPTVAVPGLHIVRQLGDLFTATAAPHAVAGIAQHANIVTLQMAQPLAPTLAVSLPEISATPAQLRDRLPPNSNVPDGRGVIVGIVDRGCDFAHDNFRHPDGGGTRILAIWEQEGPFVEGVSPAGFWHGREYQRAAIDAALQTADPYATLGYDPGIASHGTHVMDIAAGNGRATGNPGVAPAADLIFVHVGGGGGGQGNSFGTSRNLMEAADYIFQKAAELGRPAVINFSLGTHGGPHDGSTPAERWFDQLLQTPNRAIVISAGNSWRHRAHAMGVVEPNRPARLPWIIQPHDPTSNEVEIWYGGAHRLEIALHGPDGLLLATVPRGHSQSLFNRDGEEVISIIHNAHDTRNGDHQISLLLDKSLAPTGPEPIQWLLELRALDGETVSFHAWIERDDAKEENLSFFHPRVVSPDYTLGSISCGRDTITVGSYRAGEADRGISAFSSAGPTRDGRQKPELSAPGQHLATPQEQAGVLAAESGTNGVTRKSGTSMAAPHVAGLIALLLQTADAPLDIDQIRARLLQAVRNDPPPATTWHPQYGFGRVDARAICSAAAA